MQDLVNRIVALKDRLLKAWQIIKLDEKRQKIILLQNEMSAADFWADQNKAKLVSQEVSDLENELENWEQIRHDIQDLLDICELDKEDQTVNLRSDVEAQLIKLETRFSEMELNLLFKDKYDFGNAIMAIHAGVGGTDAQDWAEILLRMYLRFAEKRDWKTKIINISPGNEAGVKSVLFEVEGKNAYGYLKAENGVHRFVRISPFDAEKMRHTSFALVEVLPIIDEVQEIKVNPEDLRVETFRASGHGGQGVNTTDSAVRITHIPTKIVATCQNERSQMQNKETAMKIIKSKLKKYYETELEEERGRLRGEYTEAAWGNQARSYVIHPYKMVKDHRTEFETANVDAVLDGDLMNFIEAHLRKSAEKI